MAAKGPSTCPTAALTLEERLELANRLYREYRSRCFWFCRPDLVITEELIPLVVKGLRKNGGRTGWILAAKLLPREPLHSVSQ
jgi:hypothetical protein